MEYESKKYGESFPIGNYIFDNELTLSIKDNQGHKMPLSGVGASRSWVDVTVGYKGKTGNIRLNKDQASDTAPFTYDYDTWEEFIIKRVDENEFIVYKNDGNKNNRSR